MIVAVDAAASERNRFHRTTREGASIWRRRYFGPEPGPTGSTSVDPSSNVAPEFVEPAPGAPCEPQAFVVEQSPGAIVHPHFHQVDQFQVAIEGGGMLGRHELAPLTVHFAGAYTGYGPIQPGPDGLKYLTARARADVSGALFLPAAKARMQPRPRRNRFGGPVVPSDAAALAARREVAVETVMEEADGLGVYFFRLPPAGSVTLPPAGGGDGQTLWVAAGELHLAGARRGPGTAVFVSPEEPSQQIAAGCAGAELLVLQYPRRRFGL
jgi:hypothetical protein